MLMGRVPHDYDVCSSAKPEEVVTIWGDYAIPTGFYRLRVTMSPRFKIYLPILDGVIGRSGIRIHAGNTIDHTEGCILVGEADLPNLRLLSSLKTLHRLCDVLLNYQNQNPYEEMYIEVSEPDPYPRLR